MLGDDQRQSSDMRCQNEVMRSLQSIERSIASTRNVCTEISSSRAPWYKQKVGFPKTYNSGRFTGLFNEIGFYAMHIASYFDAVDNDLLFLGALVEFLWVLSRSAEVARAMIEYVGMASFVFWRYMNIEWTRKTLQLWWRCIWSLKKKVSLAFGKNQASRLLKKKWHALDHFRDAIIEARDMENFHGGISEASHKQFESYFWRSSRQRRTAMRKIVSMQND